MSRRDGRKLAGGAIHRISRQLRTAPEGLSKSAYPPPFQGGMILSSPVSGGLRHRLISAVPPAHQLAQPNPNSLWIRIWSFYELGAGSLVLQRDTSNFRLLRSFSGSRWGRVSTVRYQTVSGGHGLFMQVSCCSFLRQLAVRSHHPSIF